MRNPPLKKMNLQHLNLTVQEFYPREDGRERWKLDAPYQRARLWTEEQNRNLIKSLLEGIPIGVIFTNNRDRFAASDNIVDGKQRISAIRDFFEGKLEVPAEWWEEKDVPAGKDEVSYQDLSIRARRFFDSCTMAVAESKLPDLQAEAGLYLLVNFGGVPQTEIDMARAQELAQEPEAHSIG